MRENLPHFYAPKHRVKSIFLAKKYIELGWARPWHDGVWDIAEMGYWRCGNKQETKFLNEVLKIKGL